MRVSEIFSSGFSLNKQAKEALAPCKKTLKLMAADKMPTLYRGMDTGVALKPGGDIKFALFSERSEPRRSRTDSSVVLSYTMSSPAWKSVPNRSYSVLCTPARSVAEDFGEPYIVVPHDSVTEFAVMQKDFNHHEVGDSQLIDLLGEIQWIRKKMSKMVGNVPEELMKTFDAPVIDKSSISLLTLAEIKELSDAIHQVHTWQNDHPDSDTFDSIDSELESLYEMTGGEPLYSFLHSEITPQKMGVKVVSAAGLKSAARSAVSEVWFRGPFVAIFPTSTAFDDTLHRVVDAL
jgi:hypothetical protein